MNRKILLPAVIGALCLVGAAGLGSVNQPDRQAEPVAEQTENKFQDQGVTLRLDFGEAKVATYAGESTQSLEAEEATVYDLLKTVAGKEGLTVETEVYDFGILVKAIGGKENTTEAAWIYFINGKSGEKAADRQPIKDGDLVEWKYLKPTW